MKTIGFSETCVNIDDVINNFNVNISSNTEKEVAEYLGISFAELLYELYKKIGNEFELWPTAIRNFSVEFDVELDKEY